MCVWLNQDTWRFSNFCSLAQCIVLLFNASLSQQLLPESAPNLTKGLNSLACLLICPFIYLFFSEYRLGREMKNSEEKLVESPVVVKVLWCTNL